MTVLLEIKERIESFYSRFEAYLLPTLRGLLAFTTFMILRGQMGYMSRLNSMTLILVLSLSCALLPVNMILVFSAGIALLHLFELSKAACLFALIVFFVMYLLYFRLVPKKGYYVILTVLAFVFQIPFVIPVIIGLVERNPIVIVAMAIGGIVYYLLHGIDLNAAAISDMQEDDSIISKFSDVLTQFVKNREMIAMILVLVLAALIIWFMRRLSYNYAWTIAVVTGCLVQFVVCVIYRLQMKLSLSIPGVLIGILISILFGLVLQFFCFNLDYSRTEQVQFEDDEYYYYVKAIPKRYVSGKEKKVKKFTGDDVRLTRRDLAHEMDIDERLLDD